LRRYFGCYCQYSSRYDRFKAGELPNAFDPALSNGSVMDIGIYTIYPMVILFGRPASIDASGLVLRTGVDGQGAVNFTYPEMNATVIYSKIASSRLPSEIEGEDGQITIDSISTIRSVQLSMRGGATTDLTVPNIKNDYYYELAEFISLVESGRRESAINSHHNSLVTMEIIDEIRRQTGVVYPADSE
jgi:predicted dehydrogenase